MEKKNRTGKHVKKGASSKAVIVLAVITIVLLVLIIGMLLMVRPRKNDKPAETTVPTTQATEVTTEPTTISTETEPAPTDGEPVMLPNMAELYAENPDIAGWIKMEGTKLDDPVMYTPDDEEKYIYANFEGKFDPAGLPFIDKDCTLDPESKNVIIYGHNMLSGKAFAGIMKYENKDFFDAYPTFTFSTLYEEREYEFFAAFYDRVYSRSEDVFKFYFFVNPETEAEFNDAIQYFKDKTEYDTGITPTYDDQLLMLVTCAYQTTNGRFVVVAREKTAE